jgi:hypothetical protein
MNSVRVVHMLDANGSTQILTHTHPRGHLVGDPLEVWDKRGWAGTHVPAQERCSGAAPNQ